MRAAVVVAFLEALLLVALTLAQFESARGASDPATDPLVSDLGRFAGVLWLGASLLIGVLVGRGRGRGLQAAGLAFAAVASAIVASPLLEELVASGWSLPGAGQDPRSVYFFVPPGGSASNSSYLPLLIPLALVIGGGLAALEASVAAGLTRRVSGRA